MTLREEIQRYITGLDHRCFTGSGSEMMSVQSVASSLGTFLYRTADDDAERDRYAAIGVLVVQLLALTTMDNDRSLMLAIGDGCVQVGYVEDVPLTSADTVVSAPILIDALEALRQKTEGL